MALKTNRAVYYIDSHDFHYYIGLKLLFGRFYFCLDLVMKVVHFTSIAKNLLKDCNSPLPNMIFLLQNTSMLI